jgi:hypothetical protein
MLHVPAHTCTADKVEYFARLYGWKAFRLTFTIQLRHEAVEDIERRQPSDSAAIKGQQAKTILVERIGLPTLLCSERLLHRCICCLDETCSLVSRRGWSGCLEGQRVIRRDGLG